MTIGAHGRRVLRKMAAGQELKEGVTAYRLGSLVVPLSLVSELKRADALEAAGAGYRISGPGQAMVKRWDAPREDDAYLRQNRVLAERRRTVEGKDSRVTVNLAESPLYWLHRRGLIDDRQFDAGEQLRQTFEVAMRPPRVTMQWDGAPQSKGARGPFDHLDATSAQLQAKQRLDAAMAAVGPGLSDVLWRVVCAGEGMEVAEKALGWPARAGKVVMKIALDRLANFYQKGTKHIDKRTASL